MLKTGSIALCKFFYTNQAKYKIRPVLVIGRFRDDVLIAYMTTEVEKYKNDKSAVIINNEDLRSGLVKSKSLVRLHKLAIIESKNLKPVALLNDEKLNEILRKSTKLSAFTYYETFHKNIERDYIPASGKVLNGNDLFNMIDASLDMWLTAGRFAEKFEDKFPKLLGIKYCALVNSGSSANLVALSALTSYKLGDKRLKPGDEVITVAVGFPTTVTPIIQNRLIPVFVDVELGTYNIDVNQLENAISDKTKAIFIAHTLGNPFNVDKVLEICQKYNLWLIEDSCDALGSKYHSSLITHHSSLNYTGTFGDIATFSFYPAHHITMGEGGAVLTDDPELYKIIRSFRDWGRDCWCPPGKDNTCGKRFGWQLGNLPFGYDHKYIYSHLGYNLKLTDWQVAIGLSQLKKLPEFIRRRKENFKLLYEGFKAENLDKYFILPRWLPQSEPSWFGFPLTIKESVSFDRKKLIEFLEKNKIGTRLLFAGNILRQPAFVNSNVRYRIASSKEILNSTSKTQHPKLNIQNSSLPNTDFIMNNTFWIGVWPGIGEKEIEYIIDKFKEFIKCDI